MGEFGEKTTCGTVCLKYLLFTFNCCFWLAGLAVMAVGIWTLALKSDYISLLASGTYLATAYILVVAGAVVMVTGVLGCCATFKERRDLLRLVSRVELEGTDGGRVGHRRMDSAVLIWGGVPSHLPSPVSAHIPAGPTEGRHLGVSTGGPGGPPALACCLEPSPCGCLGSHSPPVRTPQNRQ
ncbi:CD151 antigen-like [Neophocaena asiaeorientalis asiaeorientalis]|uniref:CD151 antigen-like n=1 Tax=Neophocaena asiaeorientalis asiaeorientalis TaxID=1706337 RepID=A0A341BSJ5_NEOAA|nr:CD151 antigen-like [Neophocaena asiaeorientalis asiaeorientalis]